jgi:NAD(P)-dependent dehydrogenase (short-subunit alcohol dehydrogenase family)
MTWLDWQDLFSVNLFATAEVTRLAVSAGCTNVVNITDAGWHRAWPNHSAYLAAKAAVVALTRSLASELAPTVRVNAVAPGIVTIPESATASPSHLLAKIPAGRLGTPEEVAEVVKSILLAPPYLTGEVIAVDGGYGHR